MNIEGEWTDLEGQLNFSLGFSMSAMQVLRLWVWSIGSFSSVTLGQTWRAEPLSIGICDTIMALHLTVIYNGQMLGDNLSYFTYPFYLILARVII